MASVDILRVDIQNNYPTYTITETTVEDMFVVEFKNASSVLVGRSKSTSAYVAMLNIRNNAVGSLLILPRLTTTQRDALTGVSVGEPLFNTTTDTIQLYNGTTWDG